MRAVAFVGSLWAGAVVVFAAVTGQWLLCGVNVMFFAAWANLLRKERNEHRTAKESDRGGAEPSAEGSARTDYVAAYRKALERANPGVAAGRIQYHNPPPRSYHLHYSMSSGPAQSVVGAFASGVRAGLGLERTDLVDLPREQSDTPIRAVKRARVGMKNGTARLSGVGMGAAGFYCAEDKARCLGFRGESFVRRGQPRPRVSGEHIVECECGFYGLKPEHAERLDVGGTAGNATLDVELYGAVIEAEYGYRATHQRVLKVTLDRNAQGLPPLAQIASDLGTEVVWG